MTAVKYQTMPPLSPEQYAQLEKSILADGVQVPIIVDDSGVIIDGHHRKAIADHHGLHCPREVRSMLTEDQKIELSVQLNIARRQLSKEEIVAQIARLRESGKSIRRISELTSVPKSTVSDAVRELSETGQLEQPETVRGNDGKDRPAVFKRTETTKEEFTEEVDGMTVDTRTGEIVDTPPAGLDGKEYKRPEPRVQKPVVEGDAAIQQNAEQGCLAIGRALDALESLTTSRRRDLILNDWWPRAHHNIMPQYTRLFTSTELRRIADGLNNLATDMETHNEYQ